MAQALLADDQIDDGQRIIDRLLADGIDVAVGFWAKPDGRSWRLYIALPAFDDTKAGASARAVYDSVSKVPDLTIEPALDIRTINDQNPMARDALKIAGRPGKKEGIRYRGTRLGDLPIEEAYIYPRPTIPLRQSFNITYVRQGRSNEWLATIRNGPLHRWVRPRGVVSYATRGPGDVPGEESIAMTQVLVEVEPPLDERAITADPAIPAMLDDQARALADALFLERHPDAAICHRDLILDPA